jgi:hypothetical protein
MALRDLAVNGPPPLGRWVAGWIGRRREPTDADLGVLLAAMGEGRDPHARSRALAALERWWTHSPGHRAAIWRAVWTWIHHDRSGCVRWRLDSPPMPLRFLLGADPTGPYAPGIRLVSGMALDPPYVSGRRVAVGEICLGLALDDEKAFANALRETDEPRLLAALESAFEAGLRPDARNPLWEADGTATGLLDLILANPHVPRPTDRPTRAAVTLSALRERYDALAALEAEYLVLDLITMLHDGPPAPVVDAVRRVLRAFGPGPARDQVCGWAMKGDDEAVAAAIDVGYRPSDPRAEPLFLVLTQQWERYLDVDPTGRTLYEHGTGTGLDIGPAGLLPVRALARVLDGDDVPDSIRDACLRTLRDLPHGPARDHLCAAAMAGSATATRVVTETGAVASTAAAVPAFLFLTGQWDRYDAVDPDGSVLRAYAGALSDGDEERDRLRSVAGRAGREMPCLSREEAAAARSHRGPGGITGSGGFTGHF